MKLKVFLILLVCVLSFGCSNLLGSFSSTEIVLNIAKTSGDQLEISKTLSTQKAFRSIVDKQSEDKIVGHIKILSDIEDEDEDKIVLSTKNLEKENDLYKLNLELEIDNEFLESQNSQYDKVIVWLGSTPISLFSGLSTSNQSFLENQKEFSTVFTFYVLLDKRAKNFDLSLQTYNIIK